MLAKPKPRDIIEESRWVTIHRERGGIAVDEQNMRQDLVHHATAEAHRILGFWRSQVLTADGKFHGRIDQEGKVEENASRGLVLAARLLWTFSKAHLSGLESKASTVSMVDDLYRFLVGTFWDNDYLGFYWMVDVHGAPVQAHKHLYGQAFALYALAEYYALSRKPEVLHWAQLTYEVIEDYGADRDRGGYLESFTQSFELDREARLSTINHGAPKTMNTHLHLLEAYTRLYQVWPNPHLRQRLSQLLNTVRTFIVDPETFHFRCFLDRDWNSLSSEASYGHDIEGSWLMLEAAIALDDAERVKDFEMLALKMVDAVWKEGVDADHGVMNEGIDGRITDGGKDWWPQAEAVVGLVNAYQISGDLQYLERASLVWSFIERYVIDRKHGEWHGRLSRRAEPQPSNLVDAWKCPYHNTRACLEVIQRLT